MRPEDDQVSGEPTPQTSDSPTEDRFKFVFGVSEAELRQRGIDPGEYARQNVMKVLKDKRVRRRVLPRRDELRRRYFQLLQAAYGFIIAGMVLLVLYAIRGLHTVKWLFGVGAIICAIFAVLLFTAGVIVRVRSNRADYKEVFDRS
jgi:hypothetical protein